MPPVFTSQDNNPNVPTVSPSYAMQSGAALKGFGFEQDPRLVQNPYIDPRFSQDDDPGENAGLDGGFVYTGSTPTPPPDRPSTLTTPTPPPTPTRPAPLDNDEPPTPTRPAPLDFIAPSYDNRSRPQEDRTNFAPSRTYFNAGGLGKKKRKGLASR